MKFLHTGDWHIGKKLHGYDLLDEQRAQFDKVLALAKEQEVDAIVIAGDLYDRSVPGTEAVALFNEMMKEMNLTAKLPVLAISGNHDSKVRLETGTPWLALSNFYLHTKLEEAFTPIEIEDVQFFLLPYFEPYEARVFFEDESIKTIASAMEIVIAKMRQAFDPSKKHVLVGHFFASGSLKTDSETPVEVGGLDGVPAELLDCFDYAALGHLHHWKALQKGKGRYSGTLMKFSLSEAHQEKGVWLVDTADELSFSFQPLTQERDVVILTGTFSELTSVDFYQQVNRDDYIGIRLLDTERIPSVMEHLRKVYPRILHIERVTGEVLTDQGGLEKAATVQRLDPATLFQQYFEETQGRGMTQRQVAWLEECLLPLYADENEEGS